MGVGIKNKRTPSSKVNPVSHTPGAAFGVREATSAPQKRSAPSRPKRSAGARGGAPARQRLGKYANKFEEDHRKRRERHILRTAAADFSGAEFLSTCGQKRIRADGNVGVRGGTGQRAGYSGLSTCGSVHSCPNCAAKISAVRAQEIETLIRWARAEGYTVMMLTLTARHHQGQSLRTLFDQIVKGGWHGLTASWASETHQAFEKRLKKAAVRVRQFEADLAAYEAGALARRPRAPKPPEELTRRIGVLEQSGVIGWVRAVETTFGDNGPHVHLHVLMIARTEVLGADETARSQQIEVLQDAIFSRWRKGIEGAGGSVLKTVRGDNVAVDLRVMTEDSEGTLAQYLAKNGDAIAQVENRSSSKGLAAEVTLGHHKQGRYGSRTPFQVLADAMDHEDSADIRLWKRWVEQSRGRKQLTYSKGLRDLVEALEEEKTDEEIAAEEMATLDQIVLSREAWDRIRNRPIRFELLEAIENEGWCAASRLLSEREIEHYRCDDEGIPRVHYHSREWPGREGRDWPHWTHTRVNVSDTAELEKPGFTCDAPRGKATCCMSRQ